MVRVFFDPNPFRVSGIPMFSTLNKLIVLTFDKGKKFYVGRKEPELY